MNLRSCRIGTRLRIGYAGMLLALAGALLMQQTGLTLIAFLPILAVGALWPATCLRAPPMGAPVKPVSW